MGWYNNVIAVDPRDPNRVWAAGVDWFRSDDGGRNWGLASCGGGTRPSHAHVDQHGIAFHPQYNGDSNQIALIGNDGGMYRTAQRAGRHLERRSARPAPAARRSRSRGPSLNRGYGVTQFYHGTPFPDGTRYLAGAQDNGTIFGSDAAGPDGWRPVFGGDGGFSAVHPTQTSTWLVEFQWANLGRTTNGGNTFTHDADRPRSDRVEHARARRQLPVRHAVHARSAARNNIWLGGDFLYRGRQLRPDVDTRSQLARCRTAGASAPSRCRRAPTRP